MNIAIVMPTYNEVSNIGRMIDILFEEVFPEISDAEMCLIVADDDSPDGTGRIVEERLDRYNNLFLLPGKKRGLGHAYVRGFKYAINELKADAVVEMDADFQHNPEYLKEMVAKFIAGADYVIGSRFAPGGSIPSGWAFYRKAISVLGNRFAGYVLKLDAINDLTTGFRLTRVKGVLDRIDLDNLMALESFAYKVDLLYKTVKLTEKIVKIPIHFAERKNEISKFNLRELFVTYRVVISLRFKS